MTYVLPIFCCNLKFQNIERNIVVFLVAMLSSITKHVGVNIGEKVYSMIQRCHEYCYTIFCLTISDINSYAWKTTTMVIKKE